MRVLTEARRLAAAGCAATMIGGAVAPAASAATTITIPDTADLIGRVAVEMPVTVTCGPFDIYSLIGDVQVSQAAGQNIAQAAGGFFGQAGFAVSGGVLCDGSPQTVTVSMNANSAGPPFHNGPAVASASAFVFSGLTSETATDGPKTIRLR
jgi:hypothetical protein